MEHPVLHARLPSAPWMVPAQRRLPGVQPLDMSDWLIVDEAYGGQMALRDRVIAEKREHVLARTEGSEAAEGEALETVLAHLPEGSHATAPGSRGPTVWWWTFLATRRSPWPGGWCRRTCASSKGPKGGYEHLLSAAILCFPASWTLAEKIGRPLGAIHGPVPELRSGMAARVQRMFDAIRPEQPALAAERAALRQPRPAPAPDRGRPARRRGISTRPTCGPNGNASCACRVPGRSCSRSTPTCCP
jgi:hypothetical protein